MASRVKEDERNERIIRGLLKLKENRRCMICNGLGPQYVCTNFWTFVCTNCSGIHREFTHRVKSVSMAKFTSQEVAALQAGGNQRAREIYLKEWDPQRHSTPDSSNVERLRDFIRHVFEDKRYTGERSLEKPPKSKMDDKEDLYASRTEASPIGSRSPYEDAYDRPYSGKSSPGGRSDDKNSRDSYDGRSPAYEPEIRQWRSPARPEIINDWRRDDRFSNEKIYDSQKSSGENAKLEGRSPERQKGLSSSSPMVRPVRDILGDNVTPLRIIEPPKANSSWVNDGSAQTQRTASSSSLGSTNGNLVQPKSASLIDFDADPGPPTSVAAPHAAPQAAPSNENWASFDSVPETKSSQPPAALDTLESVLAQLSVPSSVPSQTSPNGSSLTTAGMNNLPNSNFPGSGAFSNTALGYASVTNFSSAPPGPPNIISAYSFSNASAETPVSASAFSSNNAFVKANDVAQWPGMQHQQQTLFSVPGHHQPAAQQYVPSGGGGGLSNQLWSSSPAVTTQGPLISSGGQAPHANSRGKTALPEDLFSINYSPIPISAPGWQVHPQHPMGLPMPYNTTEPTQGFLQPPKSANPFDTVAEPAQASTLPSMSSLQGTVPPHGTSSIPLPSSAQTAWMPRQPSLSPSLSLQSPLIVPGAYIGQQVASDVSAARHQGAVGGNPFA